MIILTPKPGFQSNPFYQGKHRNKGCPCLSGKKLKKCCGQFPYAEKERIDAVLEFMRVREIVEVQ